MTLILAALLILLALLVRRVFAVAFPVDPAPHGRMSQQWLAGHRASTHV